MVISVLQKMFRQFLNDEFLLISLALSNYLPVSDQQHQTIYSCGEQDAIFVTVKRSQAPGQA